MLCLANVIHLFIFFKWPLYAPAQVNGGSRNFYTWWTLTVSREVTMLGFFLVLLKLQGGSKSNEIWHIFRPRPQTFCSHARTQQNIVILKKNFLSTDGCSIRVLGLVNFGLQTPEIHASYYCSLKLMTWVNSLGHVLFSFARWQHNHAQTPLPCETSMTRAWAVATARRPRAGLTVCVYMDVHASGSRSLPRAATLSSTY